MKILIYTPQITSRVRYIFNLIFRDILLVTPEFTDETELFVSYEGAKISYSDFPLKDELFFKYSFLLFENEIKNVDYKTFSDDIFASSFFLVTRYEEYLPHKRDTNDRYNAKESVAYKNNFLQKPVVNIWANQIKEKIQERYPSFVFPKQEYKFIPTIDIDSAYAYREKGFVRTFGAYSRSLLKFNFDDIAERTKVLSGVKSDPYDVFEYLRTIKIKYNVKPVCFFLLADFGKNDKNVPHTNRIFQKLIKTISEYTDVGIHPSYDTNENFEMMKTEVSRLSDILKKPVTKSRQHFLKIHFPVTYNNLIQLGITDDYTMGYTSETGFRAGICTPFYFYDLHREVETKLKIHPFCIMDATLKYYKNVLPENAMYYFHPIINSVKSINGSLYTLWHNEFLSEYKEFIGWRKVFEELQQYAVPPIFNR